MKKIAIAGIANAANNFQTVTVTITEQTAIGSDFGKDGWRTFRAKNGYTLESVGCPAKLTANHLYVRGTDRTSDSLTVEVPASEYPLLLKAVAEYNETFKKVTPRHLTVTFEANPDDNFQSVKVTVIGQTHIGTDFVENGRTFRAKNGIKLTSAAFPEWNFMGYNPNTLHVRGWASVDDTKTLLVPADKVTALKDAIKEYNETFAAPVVIPQHITIDATSNAADNFQTVKVQVKKQTHYLGQFGTRSEKSKGDVGEFIHGKIRLASCVDDRLGFKAGTPIGVCASKGLVGTFYMLPKKMLVGAADTFCNIPADVFPLVKEAIEAFNKQFAAKKYVKRINSAFNGARVGDVAELISTTSRGHLNVRLANGNVSQWDARNGVEVSAQ